MIRKLIKDHRGFTLPEILVAAAVMLIIMGGVMSLYLGSQRTARVETDFADVQDNLRLALDQLTKDVRMAGFLTTEPAIEAVSATEFLIYTTAISHRYARITDIVDNAGEERTFSVAHGSMAELFRPGDSVRILRPSSNEQPGEGATTNLVFQVSSISVSPSLNLTLKGFSGGADVYSYQGGDMIIRTSPGAPLIHQIRYQFAPGENILRRIANNGNAQILARNLTNASFDYGLSHDGEVHTVNLTLTGATSAAPDPNNRIMRREKTFRTSISVRNI